MKSKLLYILLAEKERDNCLFFQEALRELAIPSKLTAVGSGEYLMDYLYENLHHLPDVLFLDLNLPQKRGFECFTQIKGNENLKHLIIVMYSSSGPKYADYGQKVITMLYNIEALHNISRPDNTAQLRIDICRVLRMVAEKKLKKVQKRHLFLKTA